MGTSPHGANLQVKTASSKSIKPNHGIILQNATNDSLLSKHNILTDLNATPQRWGPSLESRFQDESMIEAKIKNSKQVAHSSLSNTIGSLAGAGIKMIQNNKKTEQLSSINVYEEPVYGVAKATGPSSSFRSENQNSNKKEIAQNQQQFQISGGQTIGNTDRSYKES